VTLEIHRRPLRAAAVLLLLAAASAGQEIRLPEGPAGRTWAGVGPETPIPALAAADLPPAASDPLWNGGAPWLAWAERVRAEARPDAADDGPEHGRRRAWLALLAWQQHRSDDAWDHLAACTGEPEWMAAAIPHLLPGVPLDLLLAGAGTSGMGLPAGIVLEPALPPPTIPASEIVLGTGRLRSSEMTITHQRIGDAVVSLHFALEYDGIQVDAEHLSGDAVTFWLQLPEPPDFEISVQYLDWIRADEAGVPLEVQLDAEHPVRHLFGRFLPRQIDWPSVAPEVFGERFKRHGLRLAIGPDDPWGERLHGLAEGFARVLGCRVAVRVTATGSPDDAWPGVTLRLHDDPDRPRKLATMISLCERFALSGRSIGAQ